MSETCSLACHPNQKIEEAVARKLSRVASSFLPQIAAPRYKVPGCFLVDSELRRCLVLQILNVTRVLHYAFDNLRCRLVVELLLWQIICTNFVIDFAARPARVLTDVSSWRISQ